MFLPSMSGTTGNTLWLYKSSDFSLVNTGGDAMTESGASGWFTADVAEAWTETLAATVLDTNSLASGYGWLVVGATQIVDATAVLDSAAQAQLNIIAAAVATPKVSPCTVERSIADTRPLTFSWPVDGAAIAGTVSIDNGEYQAVIGDLEFLRTESGIHYYTLAYDADDRPTAEGTARYAFTDGTYTRYVVLRIAVATPPLEDIAAALLGYDWESFVGEPADRSMLNALRHIRNKWVIAGLTKTVMKEDDTTPAFTTTITADGNGNITADTPN